MMLTRARRAGLTALIVGVMAAAVLHTGRTPPVYDSIQLPAEPYNWVSPPPNLKSGNQPPQSGESTLPINNGQVAGGSVQTGDGQVLVYFAPGALTAPAGAQSVRCTIVPLTNPPSAPSGAEIRGNVYRIECVAEPGASKVSVAGTIRMTLRLPPGTTNNIQYFDGRSWHVLPTTFASGGGPYGGTGVTGFGDYSATARADILTILGQYAEFFGILALVIVFGIIAAVQELRRRRRQRVPAPRSKR
jgi:hypothetical protein